MNTCSSIERWAYLGSPPFLRPSSCSQHRKARKGEALERYQEIKSENTFPSPPRRISPFFTSLNEHIRLVNNRFMGISEGFLEQMCKYTVALGFKFYIHPSRVDGIRACCLRFPTSTGQMFHGFRYSSDRCVTPDVGVCKYYLGLVPHGSFAQH